ncbi:MAG: phosphoribosyltransferase family protein [Burkholderiales bacterium]
MSQVPGQRFCLYDPAQLAAVLDGMAWQAAGLLTGRQDVIVVGILRRGAPLADLLLERLSRDFRIPGLSRLDLAIKRYADDLTLLHPETRLMENPAHAGLDLTGRSLIVVDDVMYKGYSMLRAVEYLAGKGAAEIRTAVLVDRGAAKLPVRTDIVGVTLDVAPTDIIECNVPPYETTLKIDLLRPQR